MLFLARVSPKRKICKCIVRLSFWIEVNMSLTSKLKAVGHFVPPDMLAVITWS